MPGDDVTSVGVAKANAGILLARSRAVCPSSNPFTLCSRTASPSTMTYASSIQNEIVSPGFQKGITEIGCRQLHGTAIVPSDYIYPGLRPMRLCSLPNATRCPMAVRIIGHINKDFELYLKMRRAILIAVSRKISHKSGGSQDFMTTTNRR